MSVRIPLRKRAERGLVTLEALTLGEAIRSAYRASVLLTAVLPAFVTEMESALARMGHPELAAQVAGLEITWRCRCGDAFCTSFYTGPTPDGSWGPGHENIPLDVDTGMVLLDVVDGTIRFVEALDRPELRQPISDIPAAPPRREH